MSEASDAADGTTREERRNPFLVRAIDRLANIFAVGAAAGVVLLVLNVFIDVTGRKLFGTPFPGTLEHTANWWMPMLALLSFAFTERRQEHIKVTILLDALPIRMRQIVEGVFGLMATLLLIAVTYYTWRDAMQSYGYGEVTSSVPPVSIWQFKFVAVAGVAMMALQSAATTYRYFVGHLPLKHDYDSEAEIE